MSEDFDEDAVPCPSCGDDCERLGSGVWFCETCSAPWTMSEVSEAPQ